MTSYLLQEINTWGCHIRKFSVTPSFVLLYRTSLLKLRNKAVAGNLLCKLGLSAAATVPKDSYLPAPTAPHPATP
jgi:hypothetical protein